MTRNGMFERLEGKTRDQLFVRIVKEEFDLPPITAKGLLELAKETFAPETSDLMEGKMRVLAVAEDEPPNAPIRECKLVQVLLTVHAKDDIEVYQKYGMTAYRQTVLCRITEEALDQGGHLTHEDCSLIMKCSPRTIRRDAEALRKKGIYIPCRGSMKDMGKGISHRAKIVEMWLKLNTYTEIQKTIRHSLDSIKVYINLVERVIRLYKSGHNIPEIALIVRRTERLVREYVELYEKYRDKPECKTRLDRLGGQVAPAEVKKNGVVT